MNLSPSSIACLILFLTVLPGRAEDVLFFGNSFTSGHDVPAMFAAIAASKGKTVGTQALTKGGQGWPYHLAKPPTDPALESKAWNWIVLQDYSLNATHATKGKPEDFLKTGEQFYDRIVAKSPASNILLYETWAYSPAHEVFGGSDSPAAKFSGPEEMLKEIQGNYAVLQKQLQAKDPNRKVVIAPVGSAFARCAKEHPEILLYEADLKHQNKEGAYRSALVIYASIFGESTAGAAPGRKVDPAKVKILQEIADAAAGVSAK